MVWFFIVPSTLGDPLCRPKPGYPNPWVELAIRTHLPLSGEQGTDRESRNHINVLTSDVVIALPGGAGTRSELTLALRYGKPVAVLLAGGATFPNLPDGVSRLADVDAVRAFVLRHLA